MEIIIIKGVDNIDRVKFSSILRKYFTNFRILTSMPENSPYSTPKRLIKKSFTIITDIDDVWDRKNDIPVRTLNYKELITIPR